MDSEKAKDWFRKLYDAAEHPDQVGGAVPKPTAKEKKNVAKEPQLDYLRKWEGEQEEREEHFAGFHKSGKK